MFNTIVIGNGMIASNFRDVKFNKSTLIFASGVSNSKETRNEEFSREKLLIERTLTNSENADFVYFSTTALNFGVTSHYTEHKERMEALISKEVPRHFIFRLPQIVGLVQNSTLVSYLTRAIHEHQTLTLQKGAIRNLLDVVDLARITQLLVNKGAGLRATNNLASGSNIAVMKIVDEIFRISNSTCHFDCINSGDDQSVSIDFLHSHLSPEDVIFLPAYWKTVLEKYVPLLLTKP